MVSWRLDATQPTVWVFIGMFVGHAILSVWVVGGAAVLRPTVKKFMKNSQPIDAERRFAMCRPHGADVRIWPLTSLLGSEGADCRRSGCQWN